MEPSGGVFVNEMTGNSSFIDFSVVFPLLVKRKGRYVRFTCLKQIMRIVYFWVILYRFNSIFRNNNLLAMLLSKVQEINKLA